MSTKQNPETLIALATKEATAADTKTAATKGHSVRFAAAVIKLSAMPLDAATREASFKTLVEALEKLPTIGKGYASNAKRIAAAGVDAASKLLKHCEDPANGFKALSSIFSSKQWSETFPAVSSAGRKAKPTDNAKPDTVRLDTREGAMIALQSMMAAKTKLGVSTGKPLDTLENALTEALSILRAAKPAEPPAK